MRPTQEELEDLSKACQRLWDLDDNRLEPDKHYDINVQEGKNIHSITDEAHGNLFAKVSDTIWKKPTFLVFYHLLDNYTSLTGTEESVDAREVKEMKDFLDAVMETRPMQYCHAYLAAKGLIGEEPIDFKRMLHQMWFSFYRRDGQADSCGFEHVFVGEHDSTSAEVSGFHNWVQFWIEERKGNVDYKGWVSGRSPGANQVDDQDQILGIQFTWKGQKKPVTTLMVGTSPEFELALYTLCFAAGQERNYVTIDRYDLLIRCYRIRSKYGDKVGSCFAELQREH